MHPIYATDAGPPLRQVKRTALITGITRFILLNVSRYMIYGSLIFVNPICSGMPNAHLRLPPIAPEGLVWKSRIPRFRPYRCCR